MINYHEWWETETKNLIPCLKREYYLIGKIKTPYIKNKKPKKTPENKQVFDHTDYKESTYNTMSGTILNALHMLDRSREYVIVNIRDNITNVQIAPSNW